MINYTAPLWTVLQIEAAAAVSCKCDNTFAQSGSFCYRLLCRNMKAAHVRNVLLIPPPGELEVLKLLTKTSLPAPHCCCWGGCDPGISHNFQRLTKAEIFYFNYQRWRVRVLPYRKWFLLEFKVVLLAIVKSSLCHFPLKHVAKWRLCNATCSYMAVYRPWDVKSSLRFHFLTFFTFWKKKKKGLEILKDQRAK